MKKNKFADSKKYAPKPSKQSFYIDKDKLFEAVVAFREAKRIATEAGLKPPKVPEFLGDCMLKVATKMAESGHFRGYDFRHDMIMDAVENILRYFDNFDPAKSRNVFSYWSQICYYAFLHRISKERDRIYNDFQLKHNARYVVINTLDHVHNEYDDDLIPADERVTDDSQAMHTFVEKYEAGKKRKAQAAKDKLNENSNHQ